jgi:hypothetical protein
MASIVATLMAKYTDGETGKLNIPQDKLIEALGAIEQVQSEPVEKTKKRGSKKTKDPAAPKRPTSGYFFWLAENRLRIKEELMAIATENDEEPPKPKEVVKEAGSQWRALSDDEKEPFDAKGKEDQQRYREEMKTYQPSEVSVETMADEYPEAPEGWSGPFQLKYLFKTAKGDDGKAKSFKSFDEAIEAAGRLEGCGGITKTSRGYSLRVGPELISANPTKAASALASWVKGVPEVAVAMKIDEPVAVEVAEEPVAEVDEPVADEVIEPVKKQKKKKMVVKVPEPEPESDDDELDVESLMIDGVEYYWEEDTNDVYDDESNLIGKYVDGELVKSEEE